MRIPLSPQLLTQEIPELIFVHFVDVKAGAKEHDLPGDAPKHPLEVELLRNGDLRSPVKLILEVPEESHG